jgi:hypothetical protein
VECKRFTQKPTEDPMTDERMALVELLQKSGDSDFLRGDRMPPPGRKIAHKIWLKIGLDRTPPKKPLTKNRT